MNNRNYCHSKSVSKIVTKLFQNRFRPPGFNKKEQFGNISILHENINSF